MKYRIILSSGKEIELTPEELDELKSTFKEIVYISTPSVPSYPSAPDWPNGYPIITCEAS